MNRSGKHKNIWNIEDQQGLISINDFDKEKDQWEELKIP